MSKLDSDNESDISSDSDFDILSKKEKSKNKDEIRKNIADLDLSKKIFKYLQTYNRS